MDIILNGALGQMGRELQSRIKNGGGHRLAALVDPAERGGEYYAALGDFRGNADMIIDFSHPSGTKELLAYAVKENLPVVLATTGHTPEELAAIKAAAEKIAVFHSVNMSVGVALLAELAVKAAAVFPEADIEIVETHHSGKQDAPSGTALLLANELKAARPDAAYIFGRAGSGRRQKNEIGIHAVRRGSVAGTHEVFISSGSQTITLRHEAHTRALYAEGALSAACFLLGKPAGLYGMNDMIKGKCT